MRRTRRWGLDFKSASKGQSCFLFLLTADRMQNSQLLLHHPACLPACLPGAMMITDLTSETVSQTQLNVNSKAEVLRDNKAAALAALAEAFALSLTVCPITRCQEPNLVLVRVWGSSSRHPPSNADEQQEAAEREDGEAQSHGLLAAQSVDDPQSHKDACQESGTR